MFGKTDDNDGKGKSDFEDITDNLRKSNVVREKMS